MNTRERLPIDDALKPWERVTAYCSYCSRTARFALESSDGEQGFTCSVCSGPMMRRLLDRTSARSPDAPRWSAERTPLRQGWRIWLHRRLQRLGLM